jgi:leader peptidase (prepilin peptidase)/N-methyltransferase
MLRPAWQLPLALALAWLAIAALGITPAAVPAVYLAAVTPELVRIDLREHRLPNRIVLPGVIVGLATAALSWAVTDEPPLVPLVAALATALFLALLGLGGGIGMGDVKLAVLIGLASPTIPIALAAPIAGFLLGGVAASIVLVRGMLTGRGREARRTHIAFGPYLLAGYFAALVLALLSSTDVGVP